MIRGISRRLLHSDGGANDSESDVILSGVARALREHEVQYVSRLIDAANLRDVVDVNWRRQLVVDLDDGGMGTFRFVEAAQWAEPRVVAEIEVTDADGVPVSVALLVDAQARIYELDIFKADFSPVIKLPPLAP